MCVSAITTLSEQGIISGYRSSQLDSIKRCGMGSTFAGLRGQGGSRSGLVEVKC